MNEKGKLFIGFILTAILIGVAVSATIVGPDGIYDADYSNATTGYFDFIFIQETNYTQSIIDGGGDGSASAATNDGTYLIFENATSIYRTDLETGTTTDQGADFIDALSWAVANITAGRDHHKKVTLVGNFTASKQVNINDWDYILIELIGKITTEAGVNDEIFISTAQLKEFDWIGGEVDGQMDENPTIDQSFFYLRYAEDCSIKDLYGHDIEGHLVRLRDSVRCAFDLKGRRINDAVLAIVWSNYTVYDILAYDTDEDAAVWALSDVGSTGNIVGYNVTASALKLDGSSWTNPSIGHLATIQIDGASIMAVHVDTFTRNAKITFTATGWRYELTAGLLIGTDTENINIDGTIYNATGNYAATIRGFGHTIKLNIWNSTGDAIRNYSNDTSFDVSLHYGQKTGIEDYGSYCKWAGTVTHFDQAGEWAYRHNSGDFCEIWITAHDNKNGLSKAANDTEL